MTSVLIGLGVVPPVALTLPSHRDAALIDAFCNYTLRGSSNRTNLQLQRFVRSADGCNALQARGRFLGSPTIKEISGSSQGSGARSEPLAKPQRPRGRSDCALGLGDS